MPELPEVETVVRALSPLIEGRTLRHIKRADAPDGPKYLGLSRAAGQRIKTLTRRGKFILMHLSGGDTGIIHLGMTGTLSPSKPADHIRVIMSFSDGDPGAIYFRDPRRFGRFIVTEGDDYSMLPTLAAMGPEPFDPTFTPASFAAACGQRTTGIKALLLSQRVVAGLGNIYVDEALWQARVHPDSPSRAIGKARLRALHKAIIEILTRAIAARGTTLRDYRQVDGGSGGFGASLVVYGHKGGYCPRCDGPFTTASIAQRTSTWCERCQIRRGL